MFLVTWFIDFSSLISNFTSYTDRIFDCKSFAAGPVVFWFVIDNSTVVKILPFAMIRVTFSTAQI